MPGFNFLKNLPELELDESKKKILFIYGAAALLVVVLYFYFLLKPSVGTLFSLISKMSSRKAEVKTMNDDLFHEDKLKAKLQSLEEKLKNYGTMLSREKELPVFLEKLSEMARDSGVKILGITPLDKQQKIQKKIDEMQDIYQEVPIAISGQSGYHQLGSFINRLENNQRYLQVSDLEISANEKDPARHNIEFVVYAYTFKE